MMVLPSGGTISQATRVSLGCGLVNGQGFICENATDPLRDSVSNPPSLPISAPQESDLMSEPASSDQPSADLTHDMPLQDDLFDDPSSASSSITSLTAKHPVSIVTTRRKLAPLSQPLAALTCRSTRPYWPFSGRSSSMGPLPPDVIEVNDDIDNGEMETHVSLKRKQELSRKKSGPKKGKQFSRAFMGFFLIIFWMLTINVQGLSSDKLDLVADFVNNSNICVFFLRNADFQLKSV